MNWIKNIEEKINNRTAIIGIIGLGYVGLPLAIEFSRKFLVYGFEKEKEKLKKLNSGELYIEDLKKKIFNHSNLRITNDFRDIKKCDFIIICVPTPLKADKSPDLSFIEEAAEIIGKNMRKNQFIILESTTYPGTTNEVLLPILEEKSSLKILHDFGIAYSPERIDPGNKKFNITNTPKVVGSVNSSFCNLVSALYEEIVQNVVKVSSCEVAEAVKMLENIFRNVNIALINELAIIFKEMNIDVWEVIDAAKTKPYGFIPFYPGPGVAGHCIPLDPFYISYRSKQFGLIPRFIQTAGEINDFMPLYIVNLAEKGLKQIGKKIRSSNIAIFGVAYKPDISDTRESPAIKIVEDLVQRKANIKIYDPHVNKVLTSFGEYISERDIFRLIEWSDCLIFVTSHKVFKDNITKYLDIVNSKKEVKTVIVDSVNLLDTRNMENFELNKKIVLLKI